MRIKFLASWLLDIAGAALFSGGIAIGVARLARHAMAIEASAPAPFHPGLAALVLPAAMILGGALLRALGTYAVDRTAIADAQSNAAEQRLKLWPRLLGGLLPAPLASGESATLAIDHVAAIENRDLRFQPVRMAAGIGPLLVAVIVAPASWVASTIMLGTLVFFVIGMILAGTAARRASDRQLAALSALSGLFVDRVTHLPLIRHFGAEQRLSRQVREATGDVARRTVAVLRAAFLSSAVLEFFSALAIALVAVYCGFALLGLLPFHPPEHLTLERAFFVLAMAPEFYLPMRRLAAAYHEKQLGEAAESAIAPFESAPRPALQTGEDIAAFTGLTVTGLELTFPGLSVGPLDFTLAERDFVALTGPSGSGKTTTLAAIAGQIVPAAGIVSAGHAHVANGEDGAPALAPGHIAWAAQRPLLLTGTLRSNLALAAPGARDDAIAFAARRVGLGPLLDARGGLDLHLDHAGSGLSGGERRRIGLARALLSNRPLLLCDEPTADLDAASAAAITALLSELANERCLLVATHDETVIAAANREIAL